MLRAIIKVNGRKAQARRKARLAVISAFAITAPALFVLWSTATVVIDLSRLGSATLEPSVLFVFLGVVATIVLVIVTTVEYRRAYKRKLSGSL